MKNAITKMFPGLTSRKKKPSSDQMYSKFDLARITNLKVNTVQRYLSAAGIRADDWRVIEHRNGHLQNYYNVDSLQKLFNWMLGARDCKK